MSEFANVIAELDAGLLEETLSKMLKSAVRSVVATGKKGNVTLKLDLERIGDTASVKVSHTIAYVEPTKYGKVAEDKTTATVLHADNLGNLSITPQIEEDLANNPKATVTSIKGGK